MADELDGAIAVACDLNSSADLLRPVQRAVDEHGRIDIVVNNAGMESIAPAVDEDEQKFRGVLSVNLVAPFVLARNAARDMLARGDGGRSSTSRPSSGSAGSPRRRTPPPRVG